MNRRTTLSISAVGIAAVAIGTVSAPATAGAAHMTRARVERIAAQVVDQKAGSLSVAHADTADDASTLGGRDPYSYQAFTWSVSSADLLTDPGAGVQWTFDDVPAGRYLMQYDLSFDRTSQTPGEIGCYVSFTNGNHIEPVLAVASSSTSTVTGSGLVIFPQGRKVRLACSVDDGKILVRQPKWDQSSITFTEVEGPIGDTGVTSEVAN